MKAFRSKLEELLYNKRLTQKELKDIIDSQNDVGISQYMISLIVSGKKLNYHIHTLMKICRALECTPNDIIGKTEFVKTYGIVE
jgi:DNA-binding Xre family transcriptional regulator